MTAPKPGRFDLATVKELNRLARKWGLVSMPGDGSMGMGFGGGDMALGGGDSGEQESEYSVVGGPELSAAQLSESGGAGSKIQRTMIHTFKHRFSGRGAVPLRVRPVSDPATLARPEPNPILFVKLPTQPVPPGINFLTPNDTVVVMQSAAQKDAMVTYSPMRGVCIDVSCDSSNSYWVITVLVLSEHYEVQPVAYCLTNEITFEVLRLYYQVLQQSVGAVVLNVPFVLTDENEAFWSCWCEVFGDTTRLIGDWYLMKAWHARLEQLYPENAPVVQSLLEALASLLDEKDADTFVASLLKFVTVTGENQVTTEFSNEFANSYYLSTGAWAKCYRLQCGHFTQMHVEGYGAELRAGNLIRLHLVPDFNVAIRNLGKFAEMSLRRRDEKLAATRRLGAPGSDVSASDIKPVIDDRLAAIIQNHDAAETELDGFTLTPSAENANLFTMQSPDKTLSFTISKLFDVCPEHCALRCRDCRVCVHTYECTCPDYTQLFTICKHIHVVHKYTAPPVDPNVPEVDDEITNLDIKHVALDRRGRSKQLPRTHPLFRYMELKRPEITGDFIKVLPKRNVRPPIRLREVSQYEAESGELSDEGPSGSAMASTPMSMVYGSISKSAAAAYEADADAEAEDDDWTPDKEMVAAASPRRRVPEPALDSSQADIISRPAVKRSRVPLSPPMPLLHNPPPTSSSSHLSLSVSSHSPRTIIKTPSSRVLVVYPVEQRAQSKITNKTYLFYMYL